MKVDQLNASKTPIVPIDKSLEKLRGKNLFPEKLAKANEVLAKAGLPKKRAGQRNKTVAKSDIL